MAISLGVAIAIFNAMIAIALVSGRVLYAASRDNAWPAPISRALSVVHPRYGSPWAATLVMGVAGTVLCVVPLSVLIMINGNGAAAGYGLLALGVILGRRSGATAQSHAAMPWHPVGPVLVLVAVAGMICAGLFSTGSGRIGLVVTAVVMSAGALYYHLVLRDRGAWAHHDPEEELDLVGVASAKA
jgi:amino acid transporter